MLRFSTWPLAAVLLLSPVEVTDSVDAFWAEAARTVEEGDFEGYAALYHPDAVLVNGISGASYPVAVALAGWKQGFDDTREGRMTAGLQTRFSERLLGETTAHETGIFRYTSQRPGEAPETAYIHFQDLLVRVDGEWRWVMEYQIAVATEEEWDALR